MYLVQLSDFGLGILDESLFGVFLHGNPHDILPIEPSLQQLGLVFVFRGFFLNGIQLFFSRFRQVFFKVFLYYFPHSLIIVFRSFWIIRSVGVDGVLAWHSKSQHADGY